jgi:hypothetical protein
MKQFEGQSIRLVDLVETAGELRDASFYRCTVVGPAVLLIGEGTELRNNAFAAPSLEDLFWETPPGKGFAIGAIGVHDCRFEECRFTNVGLAGPIDLARRFDPTFRPSQSRASEQGGSEANVQFDRSPSGIVVTNSPHAELSNNLVSYGDQAWSDTKALVDLLREALGLSGLAGDDRREIERALTGIDGEMKSGRPDRSRIREYAKEAASILGSLAQAAGSSVELVKLADTLHKLLPVI